MINYDKIEQDIKKVKDIFRPFIRTKDADKKHSLYSPSGMDRILGCAGSTQLNKGIPSKDSAYSVLGTHTHTLMEFILKHHERLLRHVGAKEFKAHIGYTIEMEIAAMVAVKFVRETMAKQKRPELFVEVKSRLDEVTGEDCGGTTDVVILERFKTLHIIDYKNGVGVVEAEENKQMLTYALGLAHKYGWDFKDVWITVVQPNASHRLGPVRTWKTTIKRLEKFEKELIAGIKASKQKDAPLKADSKYCYFCPAGAARKCPLKLKVETDKLMSTRFNKGGQNGKEESNTKNQSTHKTKKASKWQAW